MTFEHDNRRTSVRGSGRKCPGGAAREVGYIPPTLTEQGVDVPQFLKDNRRLIERLRQKRQG